MAFAQRSWRDVGGSGQSGHDQVCFNRIVLAAVRRTVRAGVETGFFLQYVLKDLLSDGILG